MASLIGYLVSAPKGLWEKLIFAFNGAFKNYALAIIILTVCIKIVMLPMDYINRKTSNQMTEVQNKLGSKMKEIQERYPDKMVQNQKLSELYKKEGFNPGGSCLKMLLSMALTMTIFFTLFASLNNMAAYKIVNQYDELKVAYVQDYVINDQGVSEDDFKALNDEEIGNYIIEILENGTEEQIALAQENVKTKYKEVKESFLWIKNVWVADSPSQKAIPGFSNYYKLAKLKLSEEDYTSYEKQYEAVMGNLRKSEGVNGYFILAVLAAVTAFLYQYILTQKSNKKQQKKYPNNIETQKQGKTMLIVLPLIMLIFTLSYNSVFALYIVASQMFSMATAPLIGKLIKKFSKEK